MATGNSRSVRDCARRQRAPRRKVKSTGPARRSPTRSTRSGSASTTSCTRTCRSTTSSVGSGAGIRQITAQTVFFGASDGPMTNEQLVDAPGKILHFPTVLGAVVPIYNIPNVSAELKFTGQILADIFLGKITKWNDAAIAKVNPGVTLPGTAITVVHRVRRQRHELHLVRLPGEGRRPNGRSGSASPRRSAGRSASAVRATTASPPSSSRRPAPSATSSWSTRCRTSCPTARVQNKDGNFVKASLDTTTAAGASAAQEHAAGLPRVDHERAGANAYPISSFTWMLFYESPKDKSQAKTMVEFLKWALTDGPEVHGRPRLCAAAGRRRAARDGTAQEDQGAVDHRCDAVRGRAARTDRLFSRRHGERSPWCSSCSWWRLPRRALSGIAAVHRGLWLQVLATSTWDPVVGRVRRRALHLGHALLIDSRPRHRDARRARHRDLPLDLCPNWLRTPLTFLTELLASIPSIVYGLWGIFVLVPAVRQLQMALPEWMTAMGHSSAARRSASACSRPRSCWPS